MEPNKIIQTLWIGESLSTMERLFAVSYLSNGHDFHLYAYTDVKNVPKGVVLMDATQIISEKKIFKDKNGSIASFSDWFRYKLLYLRGGWWVDMGSVCLKYFNFEDDYCFSCESGSVINNGYIKAPAKSELFKVCLQKINQLGFNYVLWGSFGPSLLANILAEYEANPFIKDSRYFCPIDWTEISKLISVPTYHPTDENYALHLWNEIWRIARLNKDATYHPESIYEILKRRYGIV